MAIQLVAAMGDQVVLGFRYDPTGLASVACSDHRVVGWLGDDGAGGPAGGEVPATPVLVSGLPGQPPVTGAVLSPRWALMFGDGQGVTVPDQFRGHIQDFFTWLATNNGAQRRITVSFLHEDLEQAWRVWSAANQRFVG